MEDKDDVKSNDPSRGEAAMMLNDHGGGGVTVESQSPPARRQKRCIILLAFVVLFAVLFLVMTTLYVTERHKQAQNDPKARSTYSSPSSKVCATADCFDTATDLMNSIDPRKDPCENFYDYACNGWIKKHPVPKDTLSVDQWSLLTNKVEQFIKAIVKDFDLRKKYENITAVAKAFGFFDSCMNIKDTFPPDKHPVAALIKKYLPWPITDPNWNQTSVDINRMLGRVTRDFDLGPFFRVMVQTDLKNSSRSMINVQQTFQWGLFPTQLVRNLSSALRSQSVYKDLIYNVSMLVGATDEVQLRKDAEEIFAIEKTLATIGKGFGGFDEELYYGKYKLSKLQEESKDSTINWLVLFNEFLSDVKYRVTEDEEIIVTDISTVVEMMKRTVGSMSKRAILNYVGWRLVQEIYQYGSQSLDDLRVNFRIKGWNLLAFNKEENCHEMMKNNFGMPLSRVFVDKYFPRTSKELAKDLAESIIKVFQETLKDSEWMDDKSKAAAIEKAEAVRGNYGYPDFVRNNEQLDARSQRISIYKDSFLDTMVTILANQKREELINMVKPVDRSEWTETPLLVNPYYLPMNNIMIFPAAFLQPPFYDAKYPRAVSYGGVGAIIAHELIHGFDNSGKDFDKDGNNVKWWTDLTLAHYKNRTKCLVKQYGDFNYHGFPVDGQTTLAENIGDNVGLRETFKAYHQWVEENGEEPSLPGIFNNEQVFFLSYARNWCKSMSPIGYETQVFMAEHSPSIFRVNGPLQNFPEFSRVFNCPVGSYMNPTKKCSTW